MAVGHNRSLTVANSRARTLNTVCIHRRLWGRKGYGQKRGEEQNKKLRPSKIETLYFTSLFPRVTSKRKQVIKTYTPFAIVGVLISNIMPGEGVAEHVINIIYMKRRNVCEV